ncbi:glycosyltransferase [Polynucleobacter sp. UB-Raua-W9]|uniref:glycosyltransferase n=1 Tax=Polynucleobacter sp. UB-Raua-W9 TaxID=1819736 RepID=UPI001BFE1C18|nr:glycosyltransferase [Polynucleobacter sp. UB-Raua-W9]QWD72733.1 glycosyltransferase [Polynucleobacter sp. UB-Raua-W9]
MYQYLKNLILTIFLFDVVFYKNKYKDIANSKANPLLHFLLHGFKEGRSPFFLFDSDYYLNHNPDVKDLGKNALLHFLRFGGVEGRNPCSLFDSRAYLAANPDIAKARVNPLLHYLKNGYKEGRDLPNISESLKLYLNKYSHLVNKTAIKTSFEEISFKHENSPLISIIIPIYGKPDLTRNCLISLYESIEKSSYEVIVIDDCSPDNSGDIFSHVPGIHYHKNQMNMGFIGSSNRGASVARGKYLYFLNNDTEVTTGFLDRLVKTFAEMPGSGLVGSKLIYPDGVLQEAGGIVWSDGSAWNFGKNQDQWEPIYNYAREVDYCSGASIMVPKNLFEEAGGFDDYYRPAYCEDCDLALKIRQMGYRVIYQPLSVVIHHEGGTSGTDTSQGAKAYQVINMQKMFDRWKPLLSTYQRNGEDVDGAKDRSAKYRMLVIDQCLPTHDRDAGSLLVFNLMMLLREMNFQITFIPHSNMLNDFNYGADLQAAGVEVLYYPYVKNSKVHIENYGDRYDSVMLIRPETADDLLWHIRKHCPKAKLIYHTIDLHFLRMKRAQEIQGMNQSDSSIQKMKNIEYAIIKSVDKTIVVSSAEYETLIKDFEHQKLSLIPLIGKSAVGEKEYEERKDILFVGGFNHQPNVDAIVHFSRNVMPKIASLLPNVRLRIVGSNAPEEVLNLEKEFNFIEIMGFVDDLGALLNDIRVSIAPLRYGAGVKGKIVSSMCAGVPVVATDIAVEGMGITNLENCMVVKSDEQYVADLIRVYSDKDLWQKLRSNGVNFSESSWGPSAIYNQLSIMMGELGFEVEKRKYPLYIR